LLRVTWRLRLAIHHAGIAISLAKPHARDAGSSVIGSITSTEPSADNSACQPRRCLGPECLGLVRVFSSSFSSLTLTGSYRSSAPVALLLHPIERKCIVLSSSWRLFSLSMSRREDHHASFSAASDAAGRRWHRSCCQQRG